MSHERARPAIFRLPAFLTFFLCSVTAYTLIGQLIPALREHRLVAAALDEQIERYDRLVEERDELAREYAGLGHDPQEIERALDEKDIGPGVPTGER